MAHRIHPRRSRSPSRGAAQVERWHAGPCWRRWRPSWDGPAPTGTRVLPPSIDTSWPSCSRRFACYHTPHDPLSFAISIAVLLGVCVVAGYLPLRTAAGMNAAQALKLE
jgi:hypothetical protein